MWIFGREAAEIVPHAGDDARDLGFRKIGKGAADIAPSILRDAQKGANAACQRTAQVGSAIERHNLEHAGQRRRSSGRSANRGVRAVVLGEIVPIAVGR
jgi:hypothetical protein